ncbi:hypothetical protein LX32DRAFT_712706 [Colletotrichum zoysiae]|uniref:Fatty acyl-CoA reductase n=1 Tax=Colletotrichum zoysiae TaxID=1216348 RepID=A0AAD9H2Z2_9PEZI|nr:hypothetical protein LX32DRAFT_712706 [Colletotrichum zoysiae]
MSQASNVVLLTGATGFLGKVVLEELLRQHERSNLAQVILIIRGKDDLNGRERFFKHTARSKCFENLPSDWQNFVRVFEGDLGLAECGLGEDDRIGIQDSVTHIIHVAGHIKFDAEVSEALESNVTSSLNILNLAKACKVLQRLVITSTAYSVPPSTAPIHECLPNLLIPADQLLRSLKKGELQKTDAIKLTGYPNIYSLSKCLAEHLLIEQHVSVPMSIVRPSIICASSNYPSPGWIDSKAAFGGFATGFATGLLSVVDGRRDAKLDIIPVDEVASCLIDEAFRMEARPIIQLLPPRIVFCVATTSNSFTVDEACQLLTSFFKRHHRGSRPPSFRYVGPRNFMFHVYEMIYHRLPSRTMATIFQIIGKKQQAAAIEKSYRLATSMNAVFSPYMNHTYDFKPTRSTANFDKGEYMQRICEGVSEHLVQPKL